MWLNLRPNRAETLIARRPGTELGRGTRATRGPIDGPLCLPQRYQNRKINNNCIIWTGFMGVFKMLGFGVEQAMLTNPLHNLSPGLFR
jgi:hypothetical protein